MSLIVCPSGLAGSLRKLKVREANILADASGVRAGTTFSDILAACWVDTTDPGPYKPNTQGKLDFMDLLIADRFFLLIMLRQMTYGSSYDFTFQCDAQECRQRVAWELELSELPVKPVPEESIDIFKASNRFEARLTSSGQRLWFSLQTGKGEAKTAARATKDAKMRGASAQSKRMSMALMSRIVEVEGVHANDLRRWVDDLDMDDVADLIEAMDAVDGGVESLIQVQCSECGNAMEIELPFGRAFWIPQRRKKPEEQTESA